MEDHDHAPLGRAELGRARFERPPGLWRPGLVQLHSTAFYPVTPGSTGRAFLATVRGGERHRGRPGLC